MCVRVCERESDDGDDPGTQQLHSCVQHKARVHAWHPWHDTQYSLDTPSHTHVVLGNWGSLGVISELGCQGRAFLTESQINQVLISQQAWRPYLRPLSSQGQCHEPWDTHIHTHAHTFILNLYQTEDPQDTCAHITACQGRKKLVL